MKKLNNKGYLTIEIIVASVIAMLIAFFLIEITVKLTNKIDDYNRETLFITDKALIIKNIKSEIEKEINKKGTSLTLIKTSDTEYVIGDKKLTIDNRTIKYGDYSKKINDAIKGDITISKCEIDNNYIIVQININDIFTDYDRNINIVVYNDVTGGTITEYTVSVYIDGEYRGDNAVSSGNKFEKKYSVLTTSANVSCDNGQVGKLIPSDSFNVTLVIDNVTADTVCCIEY